MKSALRRDRAAAAGAINPASHRHAEGPVLPQGPAETGAELQIVCLFTLPSRSDFFPRPQALGRLERSGKCLRIPLAVSGAPSAGRTAFAGHSGRPRLQVPPSPVRLVGAPAAAGIL